MKMYKRLNFTLTLLIIAIGASVSACSAAAPDTDEIEQEPIEVSAGVNELGLSYRSRTVTILTDEEAAAEDARAQELAALSLESPNTLIPSDIPSDSEYIYYLNGRAVSLTKPSVALTYDDGPREKQGNKIMDVMALYGTKCTFFINGVAIHLYPEEVKRMADEGHEIGNHSYNHPDMSKLGAEDIDFQVGATNRAVEDVTGFYPTVMRLPYGATSDLVYELVGMPLIQWSIDTLDWDTDDAASTVDAVVGKIRDGDIILMHEPYYSSAEATEIIVPELLRRGYQLVTVSELAAIKGITLEDGKLYRCFWK